ncbi:MAG: hypothetical protein M3Q39_14190 [Actinomycetota bacterium]|nr:hypothetical protein [Actinomycetota bacterium]
MKLFISSDGSVENFKLTEPFATLLAAESQNYRAAPRAPGAITAEERKTPTTVPGAATHAQGGDKCRPANVDGQDVRRDQETSGDLVTTGAPPPSEAGGPG